MRAVVLAAPLAVVAPAPAWAAPAKTWPIPEIGIVEQSPEIFTSPYQVLKSFIRNFAREAAARRLGRTQPGSSSTP